MKFLIETTEVYRVDTDEEAKQLIEEAKQGIALIKKSTNQYKERKVKGEVADAWHKVTIVKQFTDEKEPSTQVDISYDKGSAF